MKKFWIFALPLLVVCFQVCAISKPEKDLTENAKDGSKNAFKIETGAGKNATKHKHEKGKQKSKKRKSESNESWVLESFESSEPSESKKEKQGKSSESSESCGKCTWGEWSEGDCKEE